MRGKEVRDMKHFLIYTNRNKDRELTTTKRICEYLEKRGQKVSVMVQAPEASALPGEEPEEGTGEIVPDADCMIVLGGDGTVLQAVRDCKSDHIPIIGVNLGTLGYMTEIEPDNLEDALERLLAGKYGQESRMMLSGRIDAVDGTCEEGWALNDIVIARRGTLQVIRFNIYVNGLFLNSYHADGVIVTTPTGSTGYNLSAGGPIIEPKARLIMLTPICPHTLNQRSIILSPEDVIEIEIPEGKEGRMQTVEAAFDGSSHTVMMHTGDRIRIAQSKKVTEFIQLNQVSFLEVLHKKMSES